MLLAFAVTLFAGLATSVGGLIVVTGRQLRRDTLARALAFAAGTMLLLSFTELLPEGMQALSQRHSAAVANALGYGSFIGGIVLVLILDRLLPSPPCPDRGPRHRTDSLDGVEGGSVPTSALMRSGLMVALVLALHSFPEGIATFFSTVADPQVGITLAVAIALHNVPEGIAVAAPIYAATGSKRRAFFWAALPGLTEPLGGLAGVLVADLVIPPDLRGIFYGLIAGMMVYLALAELLPAAWRNQTSPRQSIIALTAGMAVVSASFVVSAL